jgi:hypothetical protein
MNHPALDPRAANAQSDHNLAIAPNTRHAVGHQCNGLNSGQSPITQKSLISSRSLLRMPVTVPRG